MGGRVEGREEEGMPLTVNRTIEGAGGSENVSLNILVFWPFEFKRKRKQTAVTNKTKWFRTAY